MNPHRGGGQATDQVKDSIFCPVVTLHIKVLPVGRGYGR
jgi:hypothetical protein